MEIFRINNSIFNNYVTENNNDLYYCYMIRFNLKFINCFFFMLLSIMLADYALKLNENKGIISNLTDFRLINDY